MARFNMANMYMRGTDMEIDVNKAIKLYIEASDNGLGVASNNLAILYQKGENGVQKDLTKTFYFYDKAT